VQPFLASCSVVDISHLPYTPDLVSAGLFLLPKVKTDLKGRRIEDIQHINKNVTAELKAVPLGAFNDCFVQLLEICKKKCMAEK
jgi:hypothetical protein